MSEVKWTAGTAMPRAVIRRRLAYPSDQELTMDLAAVDRGEARRTVLAIRGSYHWLPGWFRTRTLWLLPDGLVVGPFWYTVRRKKHQLPDPIRIFGIRPRNVRTDWNLLGTGQYAEGDRPWYRSQVVIRCMTTAGFVELAVPHPDVELVLRHIRRLFPDAGLVDYLSRTRRPAKS